MNNNNSNVKQSPSTALSPPEFNTGQAKGENSSNYDQGEYHFFSHLAACEKVIDFKETILFIVKQLGFTDFTFSVLNTPPAKNLSTLPDKVLEFCLRDDFTNYDFFAEHAASDNTPLYLSSLERHVAHAPFSSERIRRNANYYKLLAALGYHDGYCIPHGFGPDSRRAMFLFFAKNLSREDFQRKVKRHQPLLSMIVGAAVYFGLMRFPEHFLDVKFNGNLMLTPKPLKMLETMAKDGLKLKEAASKLRVSLDTANKHVAAAKQALGATTLANAVYLAMVHGLLGNEEETE